MKDSGIGIDPADPGPIKPYIGAARSISSKNTINVVTAKLRKLSSFEGERLLDVGCGNGTFTVTLGERYQEIHGIDVQERGLQEMRIAIKDDPRYHVKFMSGSELDYPDNSFDTILSIETIEHIPELFRAVSEFYRVLKPGGECLLTCPNRLFPFENHGIRWRGTEYHTRIPLLTYIPPLHDRLSLARVFSVRMLDTMLSPLGFVRTHLDYAWPTFEHGGNPFQPLLKGLYPVMRVLENTPLRIFGTSIVVRYEKPVESA